MKVHVETDKEYEVRTRTYEQAEQIYFAVVEHLNLTDVMIEQDSGGATRNTKKGSELYYLIEDTLITMRGGGKEWK